jgi:predicted patatin/cPLA2 family phospholipase
MSHGRSGLDCHGELEKQESRIQTKLLLQGIEPGRVIELIQRRIADPGAEPDRKLAVVVEGGAMRGVYTAGALLALHLLKAQRAFDAVYGTSSGAVNAAHFLSGRGHLKAATYYKALVDGRFFHPLRIHRAVDIDYFVDDVLQKSFPLEMEQVIASPVPLRIALLNCTDGRGEVVTLPSTPAEAWQVIRACVCMPLVYNRTVMIGGKEFADGGMPIPFPLEAAIEDGCTDLLVLLSHDPNVPARMEAAIFRALYGRFFARGRWKLVEIYDQWPATINRLSDMAMGKIPLKSGVRVATISPIDPVVKSSTMSVPLLRRACHEMARQTLACFAADDAGLDSLIAEGIV